jgi:hypothetical protein
VVVEGVVVMRVAAEVLEDFSPQNPILSLRVHTTSALGWEARVDRIVSTGGQA